LLFGKVGLHLGVRVVLLKIFDEGRLEHRCGLLLRVSHSALKDQGFLALQIKDLCQLTTLFTSWPFSFFC
jgi:hypothetical protein